MKHIWLLALCLLLSPLTYSKPATLNFLIPGGIGGGWDTTARQTGKALQAAQLVESVRYQNFSGGGGSRALIELINNASQHPNTLMVQSTPLILRHITGGIKHSYRDITPIAIMIAEFQVVAVSAASPFETLDDVIKAIKQDLVNNKILGGSAKGSLDHITTALLLNAAGLDAKKSRYIPSDGGGDALLRLYHGDGVALVTGYGEIVEELKQGRLKVLGISSKDRLAGSNIPTFKEQGYDVVFANWRGFFAPPNITAKQAASYKALLARLVKSKQWQDTRHRYGWADYHMEGEQMFNFLQQQERSIRNTLKTLNLQ